MDENIKKMADLLRSGSTMLNKACPVCNNPIFRNKDGNTFCPTCNRKVLIVKDEVYKENKIEEGKKIHNEQEKILNNRNTELFDSLQDIILEKIDITTKKLKNETHPQIIERYTIILLNCLKILKKIPINRE
ncbi:MAG: Sjogren's syndrome/scleroderma autoantigen 1 family protein [Promethearchaeota archaeon]